MVKSRRTLRRERKEQRGLEEKAAAQRAQRAQREAVAARKAAQQAVREQRQAQRELARAEICKVEAQARGLSHWVGFL